MGKCYCDYCDVFLTNDSVAVRKQHNEGNRHKYNVCEYYRQHIANKLQEQIDQIVIDFELKVARGLIRPSYALPAPPKPIIQQTSSAEAANMETAPVVSESTAPQGGDDTAAFEGDATDRGQSAEDNESDDEDDVKVIVKPVPVTKEKVEAAVGA